MKNSISNKAKHVPLLIQASLRPIRANHTVNVTATIQSETGLFPFSKYKSLVDERTKQRKETQENIMQSEPQQEMSREDLALTENLSIAIKDMARATHYDNRGGREEFAARENLQLARKNMAIATLEQQKMTREGFAAGENLYIARKNLARTIGGRGEFAAGENLQIARKDLARGIGGARVFSTLKKVEERDGETFKDALNRALRAN